MIVFHLTEKINWKPEKVPCNLNKDTKPFSALWTSPNNEWIDWCKKEHWGLNRYKNCILLDIDETNLFIADKEQDFKKLPTYELIENFEFTDFNKLKKEYTGFYLTKSGLYLSRNFFISNIKTSVMYSFYGWDVPTILIFDIKIIKEYIEEKISLNEMSDM